MTKTQKRAVAACITLVLLTGIVFVAMAFGAGRRAKPNLNETAEQSKNTTDVTVSDQTEKIEEPEKEQDETEAKKDATDGEDEKNAPTSVGIDEIQFTTPCGGYVIAECSLTVPVYSMTMNDYRTHLGVDLSGEKGSAVMACADGTISKIYEDPMMGVSVEITHADGVVSLYQNLMNEFPENVTVGAPVSGGDVIGAIGETALIECEEDSHLHFELMVNGEVVDPSEYITLTSVNEIYED